MLLACMLICLPRFRYSGRSKMPKRSAGNFHIIGGLLDSLSIVATSLDALANQSVVGACKNYRIGSNSTKRAKLVLRSVGRRNIEHEYMLDSAEKIAEISSRLTANIMASDMVLSRAYISEIEKIRDRIRDFYDCLATALSKDSEFTADVKDKLGLVYDSICEAIVSRTNSMRLEDFSDESFVADFLSFLTYLKLYIKAFNKNVLIAGIRSDTACR